jgi:hypothetical protein
MLSQKVHPKHQLISAILHGVTSRRRHYSKLPSNVTCTVATVMWRATIHRRAMLVRCKEPSLRSVLDECLIRLVRFLSNNSTYPRDITMHCVMTKGTRTRGIYIYIYIYIRGPGSVVGIATAYRLGGPGIESRCCRDFLHLSRLALRPTQPPVQWVPGRSWG